MAKSSRRKFLARLSLGSGAALLSPMWGSILRTAEAAGPQKRLITLVTGNGFESKFYKPLNIASPTQFTLPWALEPLAPFKDKLLLMDQFYANHSLGLHGDSVAVMTGLLPVNSLGAGPSVDQVFAQGAGKNAPLRQVVMKLEAKGSTPIYSGAGVPLGSYPDPALAFSRIFGSAGAATAATGPDPGVIKDTSILDALQADIMKVTAALPANERPKLDQYLSAVRNMEAQLTSLQAAQQNAKLSCGNIAGPSGVGAMMPADEAAVVPERVKAMTDVAVNALACGFTDTATILMWTGAPYEKYFGSQIGHHSACHGQDAVMASGHRYTEAMARYQMEVMADMASRLKSIPEAGGSMLDNTLIVNINTGGGSHHGGASGHPLVVLGGAGGALPMGRYVNFAKDTRSLNDAFITLLNALGNPVTTFGDPADCKGPLPL